MLRRTALSLACLFSASSLWAEVTFKKDLAPVVYSHCAPCHHPGGIGPFPLLSYDDLRKHSSQIVSVTASRYMPPWPPQAGVGSFQGDRHLTDAQIRLFADWAKQGHPEGTGTAPPTPLYTDEWQMGPPDLILRMPQAFLLPSGGPDLFRNFIIPANLSATHYIRGFELRLNTKRAVHHANVVLDRTQSLRHRDGQDGQPGFPGMDVTTESAPNDFDPDSHFLFWKPASVLKPEPADMAWRLDPGTDLVLNLHLQPTGKPESVQAEIGLYFAQAPPTRKPMLLQLENDGAIQIPPGARHFTVEDHLTLPVAVDLLAIYPHAHYLGKVIEAWATTPAGERIPLIRIPDWDINWQATYEYTGPVFLPQGTVVAMRISYDNSTSNPRNPAHPPVTVRSGNRSQDEMGHVWLQVLPRSSQTEEKTGDSPRLALQKSAMLRRLEKYPNDFLAHYNLGALFQSQGEYDRAASSYTAALRLDPGSATAHNSLGTLDMLQDHFEAAIGHFRQALQTNPDYANARFNLARSEAALGDVPSAIADYRTFLTAQPADVEAQKAIASLYISQRQFREAADHLRQAAKTNPTDADLEANLGAVLGMSGDLNGAIAAFEAALKLDPANETAQKNLRRAQAQLARTTR